MNKQGIKVGERYRFQVCYGLKMDGLVLSQSKDWNQWVHKFRVECQDYNSQNFQYPWQKNGFQLVNFLDGTPSHYVIDKASGNVLAKLDDDGKPVLTKAQQAQRAKTFNAAYTRQTKKEKEQLALVQAVAKLNMIGVDAWQSQAQRMRGARYKMVLMVSADDCDALSEAIDATVRAHVQEIVDME